MLGQTLNLLKAEISNDLYVKWMHQSPDSPLIRFLVLGNSEWLLVNSIQASRDILHSVCYVCEKPNWFRRIIGEITGIGLVNSEGDVYKMQRKLLAGMWY